MQFSARFPTEAALANAVGQWRSWHEIINRVLAKPKVAPVSDIAPLPDGSFATVVADPPWLYENQSTRGATSDHYGGLTVEQLCGIAVSERIAENAHLYLWTTNGFLREAFDVLEAWGFTYKTTLVWVKPQIGMGNYFRSSSEYVLFGVHGKLRTRDSNQPNWFQAPRTQHSKKPGLFFDLVHKASFPPYLEMFARERRLDPDWSYWGNEA
jgi:N6-adenosine-specific RNA methylase IME4